MRQLAILLVPMILLSCQERATVTKRELQEYILDPQNGLIKQASRQGIDIEVLYRPTELIIAQQLDGVSDERQRSKEIEGFKGLSYFILRLSREGKEIENAYAGDPQRFATIVNYLSSALARNIYLVNNGDTITALDVVYTRMFGSATATSVMAVFNTDIKKRAGSLKFCIDDSQLGIGKNEFTFALSDIRNVPKLNLK